MHALKSGLAHVRDAFVACADVIAIAAFACLAAIVLGFACAVELAVLCIVAPFVAGIGYARHSLRHYAPVFGLALAALVLSAVLPALASETTVDVGAFVVSLTDLAVGAASVVGVWLFSLLRSFLKGKTALYSQEVDAQVRAYFDDVLHRGLAYGADKVKDAVLTEGKLEFDVKSEALAHALEFVFTAAPAAIKRFGLDAEHIEAMLRARLPEDAVFPVAGTSLVPASEPVAS